jgi:hypothetical protein
MKRTIMEINEKRTITAAALKRLARMAYYRHFDLCYYYYLFRTTGSYELKLDQRAAEAVDLVDLLLGKEVVDAVYEEAKARFIRRIGHEEWVNAMETDPLPEPPELMSSDK